jgi:AcrR family transcriptional regulator
MGDAPYHHGDLKAEMLRKGLQLLNEEGYEGFSLRKLAALCNVSHAAPYRHFKNKDELIRAIWSEMADSLRAVFSTAVRGGDTPRARLTSLCKAYVRLMTENPDYFRYIFMTVHAQPIVFTSDDAAYGGEDHPFSIAKRFARAYLEGVRGAGWAGDYLTLWSQLHGFILLTINRTIRYEGAPEDAAGGMVGGFFDLLEAQRRA